jgi:predicted acyl esterase
MLPVRALVVAVPSLIAAMCAAVQAADNHMIIEKDVAIVASDGLVLRANVFRPADTGRHPVVMSYGPYGNGTT